MTMIHGVFNAKKKNLVPYSILLPFSTTFMEAMEQVETALSCIICDVQCQPRIA